MLALRPAARAALAFVQLFLGPAKAALAASRSHWGIENQLHWVLDVAVREDDCRVRAGYAAENFAVIRHIAVNLRKGVTGLNGKKLGVKNKR